MNKNFKILKANLDYVLNKINEQQSFIQGDSNLKEFCRDNIDKLRDEIKEYITNFNNDISSIRMENGKYHIEVMNLIKDTKSDLTRFHKDKEEFQDEFKKIKDKFDEDIKAINLSFVEFKKNVKLYNDVIIDVSVRFLY